ncbi:MAG TPA: NUDIX hydrolase [Cyclobacteriaceae bacterium]
MPKSIHNIYGHKVRTRICGICVVNDELLLVNHKGLGDGNLWAPPGGGIEYGESVLQALEREFKEETNLTISAKELLFTVEFIEPPLHAIELFFTVEVKGGALKKGMDPEMESESQIITDARFFPWKEIKELDSGQVHGIFKNVSDPAEILDLRGYFKL